MKKAILLFLARKLVEVVINALKKIVNDIKEQGNDPIEGIIKTIVGGVWIGEGADAFVEELRKLLIPDVDKSCACIEETHVNLDKAVRRMDEADKEATSKVNGLAAEFEQIYAL